jgi:hypothetical protein
VSLPLANLFLEQIVVKGKTFFANFYNIPGANPTIARFNASVVIFTTPWVA